MFSKGIKVELQSLTSGSYFIFHGLILEGGTYKFSHAAACQALHARGSPVASI